MQEIATEQICDRVREDLALKKVGFPRSLQFASLTKCARGVRAGCVRRACGGWQAGGQPVGRPAGKAKDNKITAPLFSFHYNPNFLK